MRIRDVVDRAALWALSPAARAGLVEDAVAAERRRAQRRRHLARLIDDIAWREARANAAARKGELEARLRDESQRMLAGATGQLVSNLRATVQVAVAEGTQRRLTRRAPTDLAGGAIALDDARRLGREDFAIETQEVHHA